MSMTVPLPDELAASQVAAASERGIRELIVERLGRELGS